ncbi:MAG: hypothetical protein ACUVRD_02015 [Bacteroidia bacterium]
MPYDHYGGALVVGLWFSLWMYLTRKEESWVKMYGLIRMLGALAMAALYVYYYKAEADTTNYYAAARRLSWILGQDPLMGLKLLFRELVPEGYQLSLKLWYYYPDFRHWENYYSAKSYHMIRLSLVPYLLGGGTYWGTQVVVGLGVSWATLPLLHLVRASLPKQVFWGIVYFPSHIVWTSFLIRDSVVWAALLYGIYALLRKRYGGLGLAWGGMMVLRPEVAIGFGVVAGIFYLWRWKGFRYAFPILSGWAFGVFFLQWSAYAHKARKELLDPVLYPASARTGSFFQLEFTPGWGALRVLPEAAVGALVRPFPWEVKKPFPLMYFVENMGLWVAIGWAVYRAYRARISLFSQAGLSWWLIAMGLIGMALMAMAEPYWGSLMRRRLYPALVISWGIGLIVCHHQRNNRLS